MRSRLAWLLAAFSAACAVVDTFINAAYQPMFSEGSIAVHGWPLVPGAALGSAVLGAVIVSRYPRHLVGWLLTVVGATTSLSIVTESYSIWVVEEGGPGPTRMAELAGWVSHLFDGHFGLAGITIMFLLVPDGRLLSPRWRYVAFAAVAGFGLFLFGLLNVAPGEVVGRQDRQDVGMLATLAASAGMVLISVSLLSSVVAMVIRLRRSHGETRQQLRWVAASAASVGVGLVALVVGQLLNGGEQTWAASLPLILAYFFLPVAIAVSVLRYRLYDIDVIINRGLVLALGTLFVAVGYIALVVVVGRELSGRAEGFWASLAATAVVAMAFQPLRRRVVRFADRLAYGERAAPYEALADFSRRVGLSPAPESLLPAVAEAAGRAVSARSVAVRLDVPGGDARWATWPMVAPAPAASGTDPDVVVPVADSAGPLGGIEVTMPPGRGLRPDETRLLQDIAEQAAVAFRNAGLQAELAAHVEALDRRAEELEASRRRLIEARDAERRRLEADISRQVLPTLHGLLAELDPDRAKDPVQPSTDHLVDRATDALEALRGLTRGIFPTLLTRGGLAPALTSLLARVGRPDALTVDESAAGRRFPARVEAAVYFCAIEAVPAAGRDVRVVLAVVDGELQFDVRGAGHPTMDRKAMLDRVEASGGSLELAVAGAAGGGLHLRVRLPIRVDVPELTRRL